MEALMNLKCREHVMVKLENCNTFMVKLAGITKEPYFCGKDVCMVSLLQVKKFPNHNKEPQWQHQRLQHLNLTKTMPPSSTTEPIPSLDRRSRR